MKDKNKHDPANAEEQSTDSVRKTAKAGGDSKAPARRGDKSNSEPYHQRMKVDKMAMEAVDELVAVLDEDQKAYLTYLMSEETFGDVAADKLAEDWEALTKDDDTLSEEFKKTTLTLMEYCVKARVNSEAEKIETAFNELRLEEVALMEEKVDAYLTKVVFEWAENNAVAIENDINMKLAESFKEKVIEVMAEHHIALPDEKRDLLDEANAEIKAKTEFANATVAENLELTEELTLAYKFIAIQETSKDMNLSAVETSQLTEICKNIEFKDATTFKESIASLSHLYKGSAGKSVISKKLDALTEETDYDKPLVESQNINPLTARILKASAHNKRHETPKKENN